VTGHDEETEQPEHPVVVLDCADLPCPRPVIELARAVPTVAVGEVVAVLARDPAARYDVPAWCRMRQQEYVGEDVSPDGVPRYLVRRSS
jgi:tRNA 2-thiouridine synthesizing protein A